MPAWKKIEDKRLTPALGTEIPSNWLFLDTETNIRGNEEIEIHTFRLGWTCLWQRKIADAHKRYEWTYFDDADKFNEYIHKQAASLGKLVIVGHNIYFDLQVSGFFDYFTKAGWELSFLYDRGKTFILKCRLGKRYLLAMSTTNWFDCSLRDLGEMVKLVKMEVDFQKVSDEDLKFYCRRDVEILVKAMRYYIDFIKKHRLGKFSFSKSSQSFNAYRHRFLTNPIRIHRDKDSIALERAAYMGGRTECFFIGQVPGEDFVTLDVNSMYPFIMQKYEYPWKLTEYVENQPVNRFRQTVKKYAVIAEIEVDTPEPVFAVRYNDKIVFPVGQFTCHVCTNGLKYALDMGYVKAVKRAAIYRKADLFGDFIGGLHPLRMSYKKSGNTIMEALCKYMENSLYGKWGQKNQLEKRLPGSPDHDYYREEILDMMTNTLITKTWLMNQLVIKYGEEEGKNSFVAIAAHITENARLLLWNIIRSVGPERVLYCDTDSIKIRKSDLHLVKWPVDPSTLGALKIENESKELFIGGAKYYYTEKDKHIKGIPDDAVEVKPGVFEFMSWPKMTYHLRQGIITGYHRLPVRRRINLNYDKGEVQPDGRVIPFLFPLPGLLPLQPELSFSSAPLFREPPPPGPCPF